MLSASYVSINVSYGSIAFVLCICKTKSSSLFDFKFTQWFQVYCR